MSKTSKVVLVIASIAAVFVVWWLFDKKDVKNVQNQPAQNQIQGIVVDRKLTAEEKKIYEDRLANAYSLWDNLSQEEATTKEKYNIKMEIGAQLNGLGRLTEAEGAYLAAAKIRSTEYSAYVALSNVYTEMKEYEKAKEALSQALQVAPERPDIWRRLILLEQERFNASNKYLDDLYKQALEKTNQNVDIIVSYASFLGKSGNIQGAIVQWQKAIAAYPSDKSLYQAEINRLKQ